jgi:hypothetical protein
VDHPMTKASFLSLVYFWWVSLCVHAAARAQQPRPSLCDTPVFCVRPAVVDTRSRRA